MQVAGLILAGGQAHRLGGQDKALVKLGGRALISYAIANLERQCAPVLISAAGDPARFASLGAERVIADDLAGFQGPLAGILAGLDWLARETPGVSHMLSLPVDTPFAPHDLVARLALTLQQKVPAVAASRGRLHPAIALWPLALRHDLRALVVGQGLRAVNKILDAFGSTSAAWNDSAFDPFFNINSADDLAKAETLLSVISRQHD